MSVDVHKYWALNIIISIVRVRECLKIDMINPAICVREKHIDEDMWLDLSLKPVYTFYRVNTRENEKLTLTLAWFPNTFTTKSYFQYVTKLPTFILQSLLPFIALQTFVTLNLTLAIIEKPIETNYPCGDDTQTR